MTNPRYPVTGAQRVSNALNRAASMSQPIFCTDCGSVFFIESQASMYTQAASGYRGVSQSPMKVYTCICGKVQTPPGHNSAAPAGSERGFFNEALVAAKTAQESVSLDTIAQNMVSLSEHRKVVDALNAMIERFNAYVNGEDVAAVDAFDPQTQVGQERARLGEIAQEDNEDFGDRLPVASGLYGRSVAAGAPVGTDGVRYVEGNVRPAVVGGARARMQRQGGGD